MAKAVREWLGDLGVTTLFIEPASPWENGHVESFDSKLRDEPLTGETSPRSKMRGSRSRTGASSTSACVRTAH